MARIIDIKQGPRARLESPLKKALSLLRDGKIIIAPAESAYVLVADAFNHEAIRQIHEMRADAPGTACQVMVGTASTAAGVSIDFTRYASPFAEEFWPGLLTINIAVQKGLTWDLGDARSLGIVSLRVPHSRFLRELADQCGPLAVASANSAGGELRRSLRTLSLSDSQIAAKFSAGTLPRGEVSTVISIKNGEVVMVREGAISLTELQRVNPSVRAAENNEPAS